MRSLRLKEHIWRVLTDRFQTAKQIMRAMSGCTKSLRVNVWRVSSILAVWERMGLVESQTAKQKFLHGTYKVKTWRKKLDACIQFRK